MIPEEDRPAVEEDLFNDIDADFADTPPVGEYRISTGSAAGLGEVDLSPDRAADPHADRPLSAVTVTLISSSIQ
ncbi:hypothetical protein [Streptomyces triticiradicis]|uniref:Uncharacterized protein n=1 Tax=Streptomyces triticiradicis TaxID=2651189 RepID=A0A7J5D6A0_9ACTN|nr:hypothetical protein [Streptomyces triticiradicis]KAB1979448.1 hypothetical protein F8144_36145 [Streptomyces triticiradicis]